MLLRFSLLSLFVLAAGGVQAQSVLETATAAYGAGRYAEAVDLLETSLAANSDDAEAHYLLARVLFDTDNPGHDESRAGREINRAIDLDPDNVTYLTARLEQLRGDTWNFFEEQLRRRQRRDLARRLLTLDEDNPYAHEELGVQAVADYYTYRNAVSFPTLAFSSPSLNQRGGLGESESEDAQLREEQGGASGGAEGGVDAVGEDPLRREGFTEDFLRQSGEVVIGDRFDVDALERNSGVAVRRYGERANDAYETAIGHLRAALEADPRRRPVYDHIVRLAVLSGDYAALAPDLNEMYVQFPDDPEMWLYLGMMNQRLGQYEAADVAFRNAIERMDPETSEAFTDLRMILPPDEWAAYEADPETFARRYWTSRDPRFLNTVNERRSEHYARLVTADLLYRSDDLDLPGWDTDRGRLHVRYGLPQRDILIVSGFGSILEQFGDRNEAYFNEQVDVANRFNVWDYGDFQLVFEDPNRNGEFVLYSPPADLYSLATAGRQVYDMDYVMQARERVREEPERYAFESPGRQVQLPYRVAAFRGDGGQTDLYVNYGIPLDRQGPTESETREDVDLVIRTGAFLISDTRDLLVERRRTIYGLRGAQIVSFNETDLWTSTEPMTTRPGEHEVSLEFETASGGTSAVQRRSLDVRDFSGDALQLSDILLAYYVEESDDEQPGRILRDGISVQPAPWGVFGVGDPIYLFFEIYNLGLEGDRTDYEVEAQLAPKDNSRGLRRLARRLFGGRDRGVATGVEYQGGETTAAEYLILDAADQEPGLYTLTVTVRDNVTGRTTSEETDLLLE